MSRWSSVSCASQSDLPQWILLRLDALSIVSELRFCAQEALLIIALESITFGKVRL